ncbi:MAG TPA: chemotaxis protein CheW [Candidatus Acidoferrales bacterium]|jgi:chemotaxis signal transduction protein|nr:chemotaxis protein CheW [Candidatus Acidoferrales bacterium]
MTDADNAGRNSFVLLRIGAHRFALPAGLVAELAPPVKLHKFPHTSSSVSGVIIRRRRILPVYDAGSLLLGKEAHGQQFYLVARCVGEGKELSAIPVSGECEMATGEIRPVESGRPAHVVGTIAIGEDSVDVLDLEALIASAPIETRESAGAEAMP